MRQILPSSYSKNSWSSARNPCVRRPKKAVSKFETHPTRESFSDKNQNSNRPSIDLNPSIVALVTAGISNFPIAQTPQPA